MAQNKNENPRKKKKILRRNFFEPKFNYEQKKPAFQR